MVREDSKKVDISTDVIDRYQGLSMNTFGKNCENDAGSGTGYIYPRSGEVIQILGIHILIVTVQN